MGGCGGDANRVPSSKPVEDVEARMTKPTTVCTARWSRTLVREDGCDQGGLVRTRREGDLVRK